MLVRTGISLAIIALGPAILAAVTATELLARRAARARRLGHAGAARMIVAAAVLATTLVTVGVLIVRR